MNELKSNVKDFLIYKDDNNDVKVNVLLINNDFIEDEIGIFKIK